MPDELETLFDLEEEVTQVLSDLGVNEKLAEMDDFMNQNELKVNITNENATVTGLVTYTCTVKDKDNNALSNRVVEWYKGTTLLGLDATDSNGISTFSHRVTEADIYDVHAVVRGTHAGDDIRMFVKDKGNVLDVRLWGIDSLPELNWGLYNITSNSERVSTIEISGENSLIGNKSIKLERNCPTNPDKIDYLRMRYFINSSDVGKTALLKCNVCSDGTLNFLINFNNSQGSLIESETVNVSSTSNVWGTDVSLSKVIPENCEIIDWRVQIPKILQNITAYVDNFRLYIQ